MRYEDAVKPHIMIIVRRDSFVLSHTYIYVYVCYCLKVFCFIGCIFLQKTF